MLTGRTTRMKRITPVLRGYGISYEYTKFSEKLETGALTLNRTQVICNSFVDYDIGSDDFLQRIGSRPQSLPQWTL